MKKTRILLSALLILTFIFALASCGKGGDDPWKDAIHTKDVTLGEGSTTVAVEIAAGEKCITVTLKTDEETLGAALFAENLITGEEGPYGLYVKTVNGILADYDADQTYWALRINGEYAITGVDQTPIEAGKTYRLSKDKG